MLLEFGSSVAVFSVAVFSLLFFEHYLSQTNYDTVLVIRYITGS